VQNAIARIDLNVHTSSIQEVDCVEYGLTIFKASEDERNAAKVTKSAADIEQMISECTDVSK